MIYENGDLRLRIVQGQDKTFHIETDVRAAGDWRCTTQAGSRPVDHLVPTEAGAGYLAGGGEGYRWRTAITARAGGFQFETMLHVSQPLDLNPMMVLWLGPLDNMDDRQAHTWRQTILRAPTTNQQGLPGNDLAAGYVYDSLSQVETICYFPSDAFVWTPHRFYHFAVREVLSYRDPMRYGFGLIPNAPEMAFRFEPGEHRLVWWFTQHHRDCTPSEREAQRALIEAVAPLLDVHPTIWPHAMPWRDIAAHTLDDLHDEACWVTVGGQTGLQAYVKGSSRVGRDRAQNFELMTQLDVLWPLLLWGRAAHEPRAEPIIERLRATLPLYARPQRSYVANNFPPRPHDSFMDTWYFFENALIKLPWVAYLTDDPALRDLFLMGLDGAKRLAQNTAYLFPLFADAADWQSRGSLLNAGVGGLYAGGCVLAAQLTGDRAYLDEAARALRTLHALPLHHLTHEPQQLSFAAAAAAYLARAVDGERGFWAQMAADLVRLALRMGYWTTDPAVPWYDPRGMFQACASLCYPAYKENVEVLLAWPELLRDGIGPAALMAAFANLQRCHNYAFFEAFLGKQTSSCAYIPYEDVATAEFNHTGELGKELYGTGEVFWSALLFDALGQVDDPAVLCLCLDVPCLDLRPIPPAGQRRYLLYNPTDTPREVTLRHEAGSQQVRVMPGEALTLNPAPEGEGTNPHP